MFKNASSQSHQFEYGKHRYSMANMVYVGRKKSVSIITKIRTEKKTCIQNYMNLEKKSHAFQIME